MTSVLRPAALAVLLLLSLWLAPLSARAQEGGHDHAAPGEPVKGVLIGVGKAAPPFTLKDAKSGRAWSSAANKGRPTVLLFFCGCPWCAEVAKEWGSLQRSGALADAAKPTKSGGGKAEGNKGGKASKTKGKEEPSLPLLSVVVYEGDAADVVQLANASGLSPDTPLLVDGDGKMTRQVFGADPCPRLFVLDRAGIVCYVNVGKDDAPREAPAAVIAAYALSALRSVEEESRPAKPIPKVERR